MKARLSRRAMRLTWVFGAREIRLAASRPGKGRRGLGYRFIADELPARGLSAGENKAACSKQRTWSTFATGTAPDRTWLTTEHPAAEGKVRLHAVNDA